MFGWLKKWGPAARHARAEREIEAAIERTAAMAQAIGARRAREKAAQDAARQARDAAWTRSREAALAQRNERATFERNVIRDMQREREGKLAQRDSVSSPAPDSMPLDMGMQVHLVPIHHLPSNSDWCVPSGSDAASAASSDSGGSDGCGGGGGDSN
jgi:hypothetical protein